jgi:hypothetical protein
MHLNPSNENDANVAPESNGASPDLERCSRSKVFVFITAKNRQRMMSFDFWRQTALNKSELMQPESLNHGPHNFGVVSSLPSEKSRVDWR